MFPKLSFITVNSKYCNSKNKLHCFEKKGYKCKRIAILLETVVILKKKSQKHFDKRVILFWEKSGTISGGNSTKFVLFTWEKNELTQ